MGTEAGQTLGSIFRRKELERLTGKGTFAWGIGNSLGSAPGLARQQSPSGEVDVLFTPMKSSPKAVDVTPSQICLWLGYHSHDNGIQRLPSHMLVTSRGDGTKRAHYALICRSESPIGEEVDLGSFDMSEVRNLASDNPIGASQVTSVVRYSRANSANQKTYRVAFKAKLHAEGFVRLASPVIIDSTLMPLYWAACEAKSQIAWHENVGALKLAAKKRTSETSSQPSLLGLEPVY